MFAKDQSGRRKKSKPMALDARLELAEERNLAPIDPLDQFVTAIYSDLQKERQHRYEETRKRGRPRKTSVGYPPGVFFKGTIFEEMFRGRGEGKEKKQGPRKDDTKFAEYYQQMFENNCLPDDMVLDNGQESSDKENQRKKPNSSSLRDQSVSVVQVTVNGIHGGGDQPAAVETGDDSEVVEVPPEYVSDSRKNRSIDNVKTWLRTLRDEDLTKNPNGSLSPATSDGSQSVEQLGTSKSGESGSEDLATSDDCIIIDDDPTPAFGPAPSATRSAETVIIRPQLLESKEKVHAQSSNPSTSDQEGSSGKENVPVQPSRVNEVLGRNIRSTPYKPDMEEELIYLSSDSEPEVEIVATTRALEEVVITLDSD